MIYRFPMVPMFPASIVAGLFLLAGSHASGMVISNAGIGVIEKPGNYHPRAAVYVLTGNPTEFASMNANSHLSLNISALTNTIYLGGLYNVTNLNIWNYNEAADLNRGVKNYTIQASTDGVAFNTISTGILSKGTGDANNPAQSPSFTATAACIIRVIGTSSYGSGDKGLNHVDLFGSGLATPLITGATVRAYSTQNGAAAATNTLDGNISFNNTNRWLTTNGDTTPFVSYDLQKAYRLESLKLWNSNEGSRDWKTLQVLTSADGVAFSTVTNPLTGTTTFTLEDQLFKNTAAFQPTVLYLGKGVSTRYVKLQMLTGGDGSYASLTELQFFGAVPPPPTGTVIAIQ